jgi:hypothetical protein
MVVDIIRKESEKMVFDSDYYTISCSAEVLQKFAYDLSINKLGDNPEGIIHNWVSSNIKPKKDALKSINDDPLLDEIYSQAKEELYHAVENFIQDEVEGWEQISKSDYTSIIKTYNIRDGDGEIEDE